MWQGKQGTKGFVGKSMVFRGSERSRLGSAGSAALIPMQLEKGKQLQVPPDTRENQRGSAGGEPWGPVMAVAA